MIRKQFVDTPKGLKCRLTFVLPEHIWADKVFLAGSFNNWSVTSHPLRQTNDGTWRITVEVEVNSEYEFRYLCDGEWLNDNAADAYRENPHGTHNSVVQTAAPVG
jgi:1,4-alpha-glucan branching enzyme